MNKMNLSFALAFLMLFNFSSAADLNVFTATPNSYMANASTFYNFTFNISSITNLSNVTIAFPPAFHLSLASVTYGSENLTNGTTTITGQNLSFLLNQSNYFTSSQVFYIGVSGIYNPSTVSNYTLNTSTYDQDGTNNGKNTTFAIIASQISKMDTSLLSLTQASGNTYAITLTGRDAYGNANNSIGFNISSTNATVTTNTTAGPAVFSLSALSAGTSTLNYYSLANPSVTNQTNVTIVAGAISNLELSQLTPTTDSLRTYVITITGRDRLGNINNSGGFNVSILNSTVTTIASNDSTSFTFNSLSAGLSQLTFMSMYNTSAINATNATVVASQLVKMDVSLLTLTQASGNTYTITLTGRDAYGNVNNTLGFNLSSSNTSVTTNTSSGPAIYTMSSLSAGTSTLTYYSIANSSVTNQTNVTIVAGAISNLELSQLTPTTDSLRTYVITITGRDRLGNINNSGGFNVSILNSTVTTIASNDSTSFTFNSLSAGLSQLTFMSMYNTSATNATNATVIASQIVKMDVSQLTVSQASGNTYTLTLIGRDAYGNANNTLGFNVSSSNTSVTTNTTGGPTSFTFNSLSAGTSTLTYYSLANSSVTNQTNVTIVAGAISRLELSQLFPVTVAGSTYTITVNGRDNYGNINNSGGFNVSSSNSTVSINTTDSPSFTFNALASGNTTLTFMSIFNTSATNTTNSSVTSSGMVKVDISPIFPVRASGTNVTFTVTGRDVYGNAINTGGFIFSVSDGTVLSLITNTSTTAIYSGVIVGNSSFTVTSATNSTITNSTNASVIAGTVSQILLTPQAPLLSLGGTQQFTATAKDANFNTNSTVTITWARVNLVGTGAINSSGFFENTTGAGIVTINASYAAVVNLTNVTLAAGPITRIEISPLFPVNMSGKNFTFTLTGRDANGNTNNTGGFIFSVGDTTKLSLITNTSTTVIYSGVLSGNSSFTATSALDSSVTNSTNASVIAGIVSQILLTPQSPSLTVGASQQFTATAVDAAGNTNSTITINNWTLTNITGTAGLNTSGWLSNTTAGIVMVNASYFSISNLTNATISAAATPTPTPTTSSGGTGGNVGDSAPPSSTPTPTPEADDENEEKLPTVPKTVVIDDFTSVTGSFTETKTILDLDFNGGKNGFKGSIEYKLPLDYDDYVAGKITISPKPKSVKKGSVVVAWDVALAPLEDFKAKVTIDKRVAPSVLNQIAPPTTKLSQPTVKPTTAATAIPAATYQPPVQKPKTGGFGDYSIIVILAVLAILLAAYFYSQKVEKKRERL